VKTKSHKSQTRNLKLSFVTCRSLFAIFIFCLFFAVPLFAENEFSLRLAPVVQVPLNLSQFNTGIGASAVLDWTFFALTKKVSLGVSAGGGYTNVPVKAGNSLSFFEGKAGPLASYRLFDRWTFLAGLNAGLYQLSREDSIYVKAFTSLSLISDFHISPSFSVFAEGRYSYRIFSEELPFSSVCASVGVRLNLSELMNNRVRVNVEKTEQYRIFPVSWAWYEHNPVAAVKIGNEEPNAITNVSLSFFMDSFMGQPYTFAHLPRLDSGSSAEIPVTALFNEVMLSLTDNVNANGEILVEYRSLGLRKETAFPVQMPIFHRNTLSWDDDRRAAAFVSPRDSSARLFARYVASAVNLHIESRNASPALSRVPRNVRYAAAMFEALRLYGISYVVVPSMAYVNLHADESALDNLTYPYETLYYRGGDCTYISILYCSLLEALDIETAFITVPGHLYMAFDVGDNDWNAGSANIIELDGRRWLPVEITVPEEGFARAWRIGAREWTNRRNLAALFPIRDCWKVYPSVTVAASVDYPPEMPVASDIVKAMENELTVRN